MSMRPADARRAAGTASRLNGASSAVVRHKIHSLAYVFLLLTVGASACTAGPGPDSPDASVQPGRGAIIVGVEGEPRTVVPSVGGRPGGSADHLFDLIHQSLVTYDERARVVPRVAREIPSLERGTWTVKPDGTMETIWHLREDVYWHDGRPFTAADVVFSWRVLNDATIPVATRRVARMIDSVESLDQHTVLMRWRTRYAYADHLTGMELTLLPSHLLEATFDLRREQLAGHPYWRREFVGLGPFRLVRWPPGASIELAAFDRYFLGKPALSEIHVRFLPDDNTAMAGALTGQVDILLPRRGVHGVLQTVRDRWRDGSEGTLSVIPDNSWVFLSPQFHAPQPDALLDVRVRQALVMMIDREALAEVVAADRSLASHLWVPAADPRYSGLMASTVTYPYDPVRARELLREAGWRREGAEDILVKEGHRFDVELASTAEWERPRAAVEDYWRQSGVTVKDTIFALSSVIDRQGRAVYSGVELAGGMPNLSLIEGRLHSSNMPTANTQWVGANRGHYSSPILDGLLDRVRISLADRDRDQAEGEIARYISTELPVMSLFFYPSMAMVRNTVDGVSPPMAVAPVGRLSISWNGHQWRRSQLASAGSASDP